MAELRKFLFDVRFDPPDSGDGSPSADAKKKPGGKKAKTPKRKLAPGELETPAIDDLVAEPPPPPAPTFSQAEVDEACEAAKALGHADAVKKMEDAARQKQADALNDIAAGLADIRRIQTHANEETTRYALNLAKAIVARILPHTAEKHGTQEIEALLAETMPLLMDEPRLIVRVPPDMVEKLRKTLAETVETAGFEGRLIVSGDPSVAMGDARIEWKNGGVERDTDRLWNDIESLIESHLEAPEKTQTDETDEPAQEEKEAEHRKNAEELAALKRGLSEELKTPAAAPASTEPPEPETAPETETQIPNAKSE